MKMFGGHGVFVVTDDSVDGDAEFDKQGRREQDTTSVEATDAEVNDDDLEAEPVPTDTYV